MITVKVTGLDKLQSRLKTAPRKLEQEVGIAIGQGLAMAETEAKRRTPVATGLLRSSIAGAGGYRRVTGLRGEMGTNVDYAYWVEVRRNTRHLVGEWGYMEKGAKAAVPFIQKVMLQALRGVGSHITS